MKIKKDKIFRYERKWVYNNKTYDQLKVQLLRSNFYFREQFSERKVNSIYFDDQNYSSIRENLDGVSKKKKYRLRWYGESSIICNPVFEIKSKTGFRVKKKFFQ